MRLKKNVNKNCSKTKTSQILIIETNAKQVLNFFNNFQILLVTSLPIGSNKTQFFI